MQTVACIQVISNPNITFYYLFELITKIRFTNNTFEFINWRLFLILINDLLDMFGILFAFSQTLLSCEGTDCLIMQEKVILARKCNNLTLYTGQPYGTVRK